MISVEQTTLKDVFLVQPTIHRDTRGYFLETFNAGHFSNVTGLAIEFCQDNESKSSKHTLRGLHFQKPPFAQSKLVRVVNGAILDVAVDLRASSPTFGKWASFMLDDVDKKQVFVPRGFAHGFIVLSDEATVAYKVDAAYHPQADSGIHSMDPDLEIDWGVDKGQILLSDKDNGLGDYKSYLRQPLF